MVVQMFSYDLYFQEYQKEKFVMVGGQLCFCISNSPSLKVSYCQVLLCLQKI